MTLGINIGTMTGTSDPGTLDPGVFDEVGQSFDALAKRLTESFSTIAAAGTSAAGAFTSLGQAFGSLPGDGYSYGDPAGAYGTSPGVSTATDPGWYSWTTVSTPTVPADTDHGLQVLPPEMRRRRRAPAPDRRPKRAISLTGDLPVNPRRESK